MARLTASDMVDIVRDCLGGETDETISDTRILRYINQAYLELCAKHQFQQMSTSSTATSTSSGTAAYELPETDILIPTNITDNTNKLGLRACSEDQYLNWTQGNSISGTPTHWYPSGVGSNGRYEITLFPTPAGTYTLLVSYLNKPTELVLTPSATSTVIPEQWDDSVLSRATARGWKMMGDLSAAKEWLKEAREYEFGLRKTTHVASEVPIYTGSVVGRALMDVTS